jgi:hypothetical protein
MLYCSSFVIISVHAQKGMKMNTASPTKTRKPTPSGKGMANKGMSKKTEAPAVPTATEDPTTAPVNPTTTPTTAPTTAPTKAPTSTPGIPTLSPTKSKKGKGKMGKKTIADIFQRLNP